MLGCTRLLALIKAGVFAFSSAASAQEINAPNISRLISTGHIEDAQLALEAQNPSQADRLFFAGRVLKAQGQFHDAIQVFRRVLQVDPQYINARRELAHTLLLNRDYSPAEYHFNALLKIDSNEHMKDGYQQFLNIISENRPIGFSGSFSILPSTNVNRGTTNTVFNTTLGQFVIDPDSRPESGVGVQLALSGYFRHLIDTASRVALSWSLSGTRYPKSYYNSTTGDIALSYERVTGPGRWFLSPYYRKTNRQDNASNDARGLRFGVTHRLTAKNWLGFTALHENRIYSEQHFQNGTFSAASLSLNHQINPSVSVSGRLSLERGRPKAEHLRYDAYKLHAETLKFWEGGLQTSFGLEVGRRNFVGMVPLTNTRRDDHVYTINIAVQHSKIDIKSFTPNLSCAHTINRSNVVFYDYNATECQASLSQNF